MASCLKCGKHPIRKNTKGFYSCPRCGLRPTVMKLDRSGVKSTKMEAVACN